MRQPHRQFQDRRLPAFAAPPGIPLQVLRVEGPGAVRLLPSCYRPGRCRFIAWEGIEERDGLRRRRFSCRQDSECHGCHWFPDVVLVLPPDDRQPLGYPDRISA